MIIFLYLVLVLAWALLIIVLKCKKARAKRLAELQEASQSVHVVQIGSNLYDIMAIQHHHHRSPYGTMYDCLGTAVDQPTNGQSTTTSVTHSNAAFVGDDGSVYPGSNIPPLEPPPSYDEVIRLPAYYPKVETFVPEMVVPSSLPSQPAPTPSLVPPAYSEPTSGSNGTVDQPIATIGDRIKPASSTAITATTNS
ncbi:uncharacterized protein LOC129725898 [Wyeomyia smithii]|uniref:uncharacterized protein LOC129725898 n=1 Tax=Wyeomyia smithii TaxID=174621 RepID=UPI002467EEE2|nr:uncharacterized protein LOC129725898 [Wyeomyia smithii]XP_055538277.1 uncharacterized protein LOC129725898 [Wyeomyia smithii]XP_055538278.1 uncharacterized protein LOC129725898 [Wyeomyia smithii]XP_055538279.1 uncharacterized protein LOC129725898 [Wyeomyia smithii]